MKLDSKIPEGPISDKWTNYKDHLKLVAPNNRPKIDIIVVGTGLAGASAAASLGEMGYNVKAFCFQDSPRRAHSIAAQGGINAAKNYQNDGDSTFRLFYDTIKGGDYRAREANVHRLAEVSSNIIDQCVAQGVPFARDYGGLLDNRSFGGTQVQRTFYAAGQTGQQLLLGAYSALSRQIGLGRVKMFSRHEMLDLVKVDGKARGIIARNLVTGELERHAAHAVIIASGGYGNVYFLSTNAMGSNVTAAWKIHKQGALFANPCFVQIHPTCIPVHGTNQAKLTLMSESLRNSGRIWVPKKKEDAQAIREGKLKPTQLKEDDRDYFLERRYPAFGNLVPRDVASRAAKELCDQGFGIEANDTNEGVYLDFSSEIQNKGKQAAYAKGNHNPTADEITSLGKQWLEEKYGKMWFKKGVPPQIGDEAVALATKKNRDIENEEDEVEPWDCVNIIAYRAIAVKNWSDVFEKRNHLISLFWNENNKGNVKIDLKLDLSIYLRTLEIYSLVKSLFKVQDAFVYPTNRNKLGMSLNIQPL